MKVPPRSAEASSSPVAVGHSTLAATPAASSKQATAKARSMPHRVPSQSQAATVGAPARANVYPRKAARVPECAVRRGHAVQSRPGLSGGPCKLNEQLLPSSA